MSDLNSAIEGAILAGASSVVVYDGHYFGMNVEVGSLHQKARAVLGKPDRLPGGGWLDPSYAAMMLVGYHAMAGTEGGLLTHTYSLDIDGVWVNGQKVGEVGMEVLLAAEAGVPTVMVAGDSRAIEEARILVPGIEAAQVKLAIGEESAECLPLGVTRDLIRERAKAALDKLQAYQLYPLKLPAEVEVKYYDCRVARKVVNELGCAGSQGRVDEGIVRMEPASLFEAWLTLDAARRRALGGL